MPEIRPMPGFTGNVAQYLQKLAPFLRCLGDFRELGDRLFGGAIDYTAEYRGSGTMTTTPTSNVGVKFPVGKWCIFSCAADLTLGGVADSVVWVKLPYKARSRGAWLWPLRASITDGGGFIASAAGISTTGIEAYVKRYDGANFSLGANRLVTLCGIYEVE